MIECQARFPKFPGEAWNELTGDTWQQISLSSIKRFRFRFHGNIVEDRKHLNAYLEREIIHAKLQGKHVRPRFSNHEYKK